MYVGEGSTQNVKERSSHFHFNTNQIEHFAQLKLNSTYATRGEGTSRMFSMDPGANEIL